jgi:hypothetical protein
MEEKGTEEFGEETTALGAAAAAGGRMGREEERQQPLSTSPQLLLALLLVVQLGTEQWELVQRCEWILRRFVTLRQWIQRPANPTEQVCV